jgi:fructose-1,6-bisphosphatase/inositol monophosphatase family enzyme
MLVFISYPSSDKALADQVADLCRQDGHEPFVAQESSGPLVGGGGFASGLCSTIDRCDAFVLCVTEQSLRSHFQKLEWNYAISQGKETPFVVTRGRTADPEFARAFPFSNVFQWCRLDDPKDVAEVREYLGGRSTSQDDEERFQWMQQAAMDAGFRLTARYGVGHLSGPPVLLDGQKNPATNFDVDIEHHILKSLQERYTNEPVLAEETIEKDGNVWDGDPRAEWIWTVDAIDGTLNFIAGDDRYCCGIGLLHHGKPHLGAIFVPSQMLLFAGGVGRKATVRNLRDGSVQTLKADQTMKDLGKCWTLTHINSRPEEVACGFAHDIPRRLHDAVRRVWMWGCGLVSFTALARGTHHLFAQRVIWPWDVVPGLALAHAAGAVSTAWPSPQPREWTFTGTLKSDVVAACNPEILRAAVAALKAPGVTAPAARGRAGKGSRKGKGAGTTKPATRGR